MNNAGACSSTAAASGSKSVPPRGSKDPEYLKARDLFKAHMVLLTPPPQLNTASSAHPKPEVKTQTNIETETGPKPPPHTGTDRGDDGDMSQRLVA